MMLAFAADCASAVVKVAEGANDNPYSPAVGCFAASVVWPTLIQTTVIARQGDGKHDFLELYCGNGNFTLPLAQYFGQAFATEIVRQSVKVH
jgi:tRNA/tmRNA/rRNA uracil-C5-methylase (TrmA/RlmC/RlmD family)